VSRRSRIAIGILGFFAVTIIAFGVGDVLAGASADAGITKAISGMGPAEVQAEDPTGYRLYDFATRTNGLVLAILGTLMTAIIVVPYRAGQRWAWRVMWTLPAWALSVPLAYLVAGVAPGQPPAPPMVSGVIVAVVAGAGLLIDRVRFAASDAALSRVLTPETA
jgi:hypothetical protein